MNSLERKSLMVDGGLKYVYHTSGSRNNSPTILLFHGCPDTASLWSNLISTHLLSAGYGILAPDLLGYGETDKPTELQHYGIPSICRQVLTILDHEKQDKAIVLGHDFGAMLASKLCTYHPDRVAGLITLGTAFIPPSPYPFNFEQVKAIQEQYQGYCSSWYFPLFTSDHGAAMIDSHLEQMFTVLHGGGPRMKEVLCVKGGIEKWLEDASNTETKVLPYAREPKFREAWISRLKRDGWTTPLMWYKAVVADLALEADKTALRSGWQKLKLPYLFVAANQDPLAPAAAAQGLQAMGLLSDMTVKEVESSHWCMLERPKERVVRSSSGCKVDFRSSPHISNDHSPSHSHYLQTLLVRIPNASQSRILDKSVRWPNTEGTKPTSTKIRMTNPFASERLIYRALEPEEDEEWILREIHQVPILISQTNPVLHVPQARKDVKESFKSMAEGCLLSVVVCLPVKDDTSHSELTRAATDTTTTSAAAEDGEKKKKKKAEDQPPPKPKPTPIGLLLLFHGPMRHAHHRSAEIGITLCTPYHGQGYGTEAINWCLEWSFLTAGLHRVGIGAFTHNEGAVKLYGRLGFTEEGRWRECLWYQGRWEGVVLWSMLEGEWRGRVKGKGAST
ncbi:hypothetical protein LTR86_002759 [Recurvomyces mirabilis]|nr:hypothetical protein LTR86_002759 [Recurvomyces mirabilis]